MVKTDTNGFWVWKFKLERLADQHPIRLDVPLQNAVWDETQPEKHLGHHFRTITMPLAIDDQQEDPQIVSFLPISGWREIDREKGIYTNMVLLDIKSLMVGQGKPTWKRDINN